MTGLNLYVYIYIHIRVYTCVQQAATDLSVQRLATGWTVQGSNPSRGEIFRNRPDRPWGPPSPYTMGTGFFLGVNWPESGVDHPPHFVPRLKKEQSYTSTPLWAFVACYRVEFYLYYIYIYTGCPRRNVPDFGRVFLMLNYTDITQNTYIQI